MSGKARPWLKTEQVQASETLVRRWARSNAGWKRLQDKDGVSIWVFEWKPDAATWPGLASKNVYKVHARIDAAPQRVFDLLIDIAAMPSWNTAVLGKRPPRPPLCRGLSDLICARARMCAQSIG